MEQLFNQLLRPKLRNFILDLYKDVSYILDEDTYATAEYQDIVRKRFIKSWEILIDGYKVFTANHFQGIYLISYISVQELFTEANYSMFFSLALDTLIRPWEKFVLAMKYSEVSRNNILYLLF